MRRLIGFFLIVRALAPVLMVVVVVWGLGDMFGALQTALAEPVADIRAKVDALEVTINEARDQFETVKTEVEQFIADLGNLRIPDIFPDLSGLITLPAINIPDFTIQIPTGVNIEWRSFSTTVNKVIEDCSSIPIIGWFCDNVIKPVTQVIQYPSNLSFSYSNFTVRIPDLPSLSLPMPPIFDTIAAEIRGLFSGVTDALNVFDGAFTSIRALGEDLQTLSEHFGSVLGEGRNLVNGVKNTLAKWSGVLILVVAIIGVLLAIYFVVPFLDDFTRGWRMLFGPAPRA